MVWARLAVSLEGARIGRNPLAVWQDRTGPGHSSFDRDKLLDDARGSALVRALDELTAEGGLIAGTRVSATAAERAAWVFAQHLELRLDVIRRSEARAQALLVQVDACLLTTLCDSAFGAGKEQLREHVAVLRDALGGSFPSMAVEADTKVVERFFMGLHEEVEAYRCGIFRAGRRF